MLQTTLHQNVCNSSHHWTHTCCTNGWLLLLLHAWSSAKNKIVITSYWVFTHTSSALISCFKWERQTTFQQSSTLKENYKPWKNKIVTENPGPCKVFITQKWSDHQVMNFLPDKKAEATITQSLRHLHISCRGTTPALTQTLTWILWAADWWTCHQWMQTSSPTMDPAISEVKGHRSNRQAAICQLLSFKGLSTHFHPPQKSPLHQQVLRQGSADAN